MKDASLVITGEGRIDSQTLQGKVPIGVARVAKRHQKPVIGIAGSLTADWASCINTGWTRYLACFIAFVLWSRRWKTPAKMCV